ncbi:hypothetical protein D7B24_005055 [Verticillium nonalfalfae]|uniref:Uncharacterized protein n=2 Tax=Verticillium TaxID=1036719 RepID=A0A0G4LFI5_VERLO|nr:uncharacterized protein D7B24_005055 [Verticillium nonalfalfae]RNJ60967.1 hypothetical protein D7B24_005055 [Verticillium nonalfalfae]CRK20783.1 hypothetical protein BN1708_012929 [Verticillium longisporum]
MCEWYRREFGCRHYLIGAASWCPDYSRTGRRCEVRVVYIDYSAGDCTGCSNRRTEESVPWEHMINRSRCGWPESRLTGKVLP